MALTGRLRLLHGGILAGSPRPFDGGPHELWPLQGGRRLALARRTGLMMMPQAATNIEATMTIGHDDAVSEVAVISPAGRVTLGQRSEQIEELVEKMLSAGKKIIVFDLAGITKIDSTGIGRFISSYNKIRSVGGEMRMAGATEHLSKIFRVTRLDSVFRFYTTVADALKS
jgi:anti-sigma B factor antagonist